MSPELRIIIEDISTLDYGPAKAGAQARIKQKAVTFINDLSREGLPDNLNRKIATTVYFIVVDACEQLVDANQETLL